LRREQLEDLGEVWRLELDEELAFEHEEDDDYEDDLLAAECIFVGHSWDRPQQFGTCFYHCRDHGELDDEESGLDLDELLATRKEALWRAVIMRDGQESRAPTESAAAAATAGALAVLAIGKYFQTKHSSAEKTDEPA
jgi:hypothetical protein